LQNPSQINAENINNVRCESSRTLREKMREYFKEKLIRLKQAVRKNIRELHRGRNKLQEGYRHRR
jgi:hypothetical protein